MKKSYATAIRLFSCDFLFVDRPLFNFKQVILILVGNNPDKGNNTDYGSSETGYSFQQIRGVHKCNSVFLIMQTFRKNYFTKEYEMIECCPDALNLDACYSKLP